MFVRTGAGEGWLAASGKADDVLIHSVKRSRNALYIELTDRSRPGYLGSWGSKAFVNVADPLAVLGVYSGLSPSVSRIDGEELFRAFAQATLAAENSAKYPLLHNKAWRHQTRYVGLFYPSLEQPAAVSPACSSMASAPVLARSTPRLLEGNEVS